MKSVHTLKKFKCDYCDILVEATNDLGAVLSMQKHLEICLCKSNQVLKETMVACDFCSFISKSEDVLKRHKRDEHDNSTKSISPKPKRRRKLVDGEATEIEEVKVEQMETEESKEGEIKEKDLVKEAEVFWNDARSSNMHQIEDVDMEEEILSQRSKLHDEKVEKKNMKINQEENEYRRKKENDALKKREIETEQKNASKRTKKNLQKKKKKNSIQQKEQICKR